jgi:hypothetical protein
VDFSAERRKPDPSSTEPASNSTSIAPRARGHIRLLPEFPKPFSALRLSALLPAPRPDRPANQRPLPIALFLRYNPIASNPLIMERVETARESVLTLRRRNRPLLTCIKNWRKTINYLNIWRIAKSSEAPPPRALPKLSDALDDRERCRTMARKWDEVNCKLPRRLSSTVNRIKLTESFCSCKPLAILYS